MKKLLVLFLLISMAAVNANAWWVSWGHMKETSEPDGTVIRECVGAGICGGGGGKAALHLFNRRPDFNKMAQIDIGIRGDSMTIVIKKLIGSKKEKLFILEENTDFDKESARNLGYKSIVLKKGEYPIEYSKKYPNGRITVQMIGKK